MYKGKVLVSVVFWTDIFSEHYTDMNKRVSFSTGFVCCKVS